MGLWADDYAHSKGNTSVLAYMEKNTEKVVKKINYNAGDFPLAPAARRHDCVLLRIHV